MFWTSSWVATTRILYTYSWNVLFIWLVFVQQFFFRFFHFRYFDSSADFIQIIWQTNFIWIKSLHSYSNENNLRQRKKNWRFVDVIKCSLSKNLETKTSLFPFVGRSLLKHSIAMTHWVIKLYFHFLRLHRGDTNERNKNTQFCLSTVTKQLTTSEEVRILTTEKRRL